jgi:predicted transposase YbfD/YdcC
VTSRPSGWRLFPPEHTTTDKVHGRLETRKIWTSKDLQGYIDFPYGRTVFQIERHTVFIKSGKCREEMAYGVTSVEDTPERILGFNRGHWEIENRLHWVRDVTFDEDRCQIRKGNGARIMASIRNLVISLIRLLTFRYIPQGLRYFSTHLEDVLQLVGV